MRSASGGSRDVELSLRRCGARAVLVETPPGGVKPYLLADSLRTALVDSAEDVVPGHRTVLVSFRQSVPSLRELRALIERAAEAPTSVNPTTLSIAVQYDGADLHAVASATGLAEEQVIQRHLGRVYEVAFMGFAPGFGYLTGLDPSLHLPRLAEPRPHVPPGSLAIAGPYTAIYPRRSPGGWHILGTTDLDLFNAGRDPPALLAAGMTVQFRRS